MRNLRDNTLSISTTLSAKNTPHVDGVFFDNIKNEVLGKNYELSLVFVGKKLGKRLNYQYRKKNYATDILSFSVDKNVGEIFIHPDKARQKSKEFGRDFKNYISFIFIHGLFHLKGFDHGSTMERKEARVRTLFNI